MASRGCNPENWEIRHESRRPWVLALYIAFVFVQSLFFKFSAAEESIFIFQTIEDWSGLPFFEPFMRNFIGASELVCSVLLFIPRTQVLARRARSSSRVRSSFTSSRRSASK